MVSWLGIGLIVENVALTTYTWHAPAKTLVILKVIKLNTTAKVPKKARATEPIVASQLDHFGNHQSSTGCCSGKPPVSAVAMFEAIILIGCN